MLLQTLPILGNHWCDKCILINRFMKGIFLKKPPVPRYKFTWDVSKVIQFLASLFPLDGLSMKMLTFKVTALIALAAAPRAQTMVSMNLDFMRTDMDSVSFVFPCVLKTSRVGHDYCLKLEHFQKEELCVMHTLLYYIDRTRLHRQCNQVLISYITFRAITTSTVARWLKQVLELSGVNTDTFKAHSFRGASTSKAYFKGCSLKRILDTADWSSDKTFKKFYCRRPANNLSFSQAVFS